MDRNERIKDEIFLWLSQKMIQANSMWIFHHYKVFIANCELALSHIEFHNTMQELCNEGYFNIKEDYPERAYVLTQKGRDRLDSLL